MTPAIRLVMRARLTEGRHAFRRALARDPLQVALLVAFLVTGFAGLAVLFSTQLRALSSIAPTPEDRDTVLGLVLPILFISLFLMLAVSSGITQFAGLFRPREGDPLVSWPVGDREQTLIRFAEGFTFSTWAFLFLCGPLYLAWALELGPSIFFLPLVLVSSVVFALLACSLGSLAAALCGRFMPRSRRALFLTLLGAVAVVAGRSWISMRGLRKAGLMPGAMLGTLSEELSFAFSGFSPSAWMSAAFEAAVQGDFRECFWSLALMLSTAMMALHLSGVLLDGRLATCRERVVPKRGRARSGLITWLLGPRREGGPRRLLLWKDLLVFARDPSQWMQLLLFFGLLAAYFMNLQRYESLGHLVHRGFVAFVNLSALLLTLSTFTSRFVFPQMSLEGRRFWLLGLAPLPRRSILGGKFLLSLAGSFLIAGSLSFLSCQRLNLGLAQTVVEVLVAFSVCLGLSGLACGLGIRFPNFTAQSAPKVVSGVGGTLHLAAATVFLALELALAYPAVVRVHSRTDLFTGVVPWVFTACLMLGIVTAITAMKAGQRHLERLEF